MKIEVVGPGCWFCKRLYKRVKEMIAEENIEAEVVHLTDWKTVFKYFPMTPALIVDGQVRHKGKFLPKKEKLKQLIYMT